MVILKRTDVRGTPWLHHRSPYTRILGIGTNSGGAKAQGITFPAGSAMSDLAAMVRPRPMRCKTVCSLQWCYHMPVRHQICKVQGKSGP